MSEATILVGDVRQRLSDIADGSVQCCVTSPPYWGLRDYGADGQIGLEQTPDAYVAEMVGVFREVWRVMRDDGVLWLNLGDSYAGSGKGRNGDGSMGKLNSAKQLSSVGSYDGGIPATKVIDGLKPKDLVGIPWRVAFALQADGWYLRQDIIWAKPNPMPESVTDRCTKAHEYVFMLTKSARYYFDNVAIKEPSANLGTTKIKFGGTKYGDSDDPKHATKSGNEYTDNGTRNKRSVWTITTKPFRGAHFAVMPEALVEPCVLSSTSEHGACTECDVPWKRKLERGEIAERKTRDAYIGVIPGRDSATRMNSVDMEAIPFVTVGWEPSCECGVDTVKPCLVLDPFTGSGTVAVVALKNGRNFVGVELNPEYAEIARKRIESSQPMFNEVIVDFVTPL
jgi:DNA modification methylase